MLRTPSPQKQPVAIQTANTTAHKVAPKQIHQKKLISKGEYSLREEWAPETLKEYRAPSDEPSPHTAPRKEQHHATIGAGVQGRVPNRRTQARSSLFKEWKAQALRSSEMVKVVDVTHPTAANGGSTVEQAGDTTPASAQLGNNETEAVAASTNTIEPLGEHSAQAVKSQGKSRAANNEQDHQKEHTKVDVASMVKPGTHARGPSSTSSNPIINPTTTARKRAPKKGKANNRQGNGEDKIYTSPNGTRLSKSELKELSLGIKAEGMDKVYFLPCFIEDPWKGLQPMPAVQPAGMAV